MTHPIQRIPVTLINQRKGFRIHLLVFLIATPATWLAWYLSASDYAWPLWQTPAWAVGVLFHYLGVFVFKKSGPN